MKLLKGKGEKTENKRIHLFIVPIIVALMLICVITIIFVGEHSVRPRETAELNKDVEQEEHISAATDIAATSIGTNAKATFTASTGEIHIYNSSSTADATINKKNWYTFLDKIWTANINGLDVVKSITFDDKVYAPADSSRLFYPLLGTVNFPFKMLTTINNLSNLNLSKTTNISSMFENCYSLVSINGFNRGANDVEDLTTMRRCFYGCSSLETIVVESWVNGDLGNPSTWDALSGCSSLREFRWSYTGASRVYMFDLESFKDCISLEILYLSRCGDLSMGQRLSEGALGGLRMVTVTGMDSSAYCTNLKKVAPRLETLDFRGVVLMGEERGPKSGIII